MPTYQTPGVYIEELPAPQTIEGVSTSTAGFVGLTTKGPSLGNRLITSFAAFQRIFGGYVDESWGNARYLAFAVEGFFRNGGNLAYVARIVGDGATAAERRYNNGFNTRLAADTAAEQTARDTVRLTSLYGIDVGDRLIFRETFAGVPITETRRVIRYDAQTRRVWLEAALTSRFTAARCVVTQENVPAPEPGTSEARLTVRANSEGLWGDALSVEVAPSYGAGAITRAATVDFSTTLLPRPLAFAEGGPAQGALETVLAGADVQIGDVLLLTNPDGHSEERLLITAEQPEGAPDTTRVVWERPLQHAYDAAGSTVERITRVLEPVTPAYLTFAVAGPAADATSIEVVSVSGVSVGDVIEFVSPDGTVSRRRIVTAVDPDGLTVAWEGELGVDFADDATVRHVTHGDPVDLAFAADPPAADATEVELVDASAVTVNAILEFADAAGSTVRVVVDQVEDTTVRWSGELGLADVATVRLLPVAQVVELALLGTGPAASATDVRVSGDPGVRAFDAIEFRNPSTDPPLVVRRVVTNVVGNQIEFEALGATESFDVPGATALWIASPRARVASTAELAAEMAAAEDQDSGPVLVRVRQGGWSQILEVLEIDGDEVVFNGATRPVARAFAASEAGILTTLERALAGRAGSRNLDLGSAANLYARAVIEIDDGSQKSYHRVDSVDGNTLTLIDALTEGVPGGVTVRVVELSVAVEEEDGASELFQGLSLDPAAERFAPTVIGRGSRLITVAVEGELGPLPFDLPQVRWSLLNATPPVDPTRLTGGSDGGVPTAGAYIGRDDGPGQRTGIAALADQDDVALVAVPGITDPDVQIALLDHCALLKSRFAILDSAPGSPIGTGTADDVLVQRSQFDSLYGAIYFPWLRTRNPLDDDDPDGLLVPPSGHVAGICARVDQERGVHKAPANETVRGITDVELKVSDREQAVLNPAAVNVIRDFRDKQRGLRVYGARVLTTNVAWRYVPVRRLAIFIEQSLNVGLQWVVFEPNAEPLWAKVRRTVENFLTVVWRNGALEGITPEEAFQVQCGRGTMSPDDIASGRLIVVVGFAPVRPAEFVIIRVFQKTREAA